MGKISSLKEKLLEDMKEAMKNKDKERLSVIRMARASIKNVEIDKRTELSDDDIAAVIAREVKQRQESIEEYKKAGRTETVERLEREKDILSDYLPEQLSREEIEKLVEEVIDEVGAMGMADMGKVMGVIMPRVKGRADGSVVNAIVREKLG